MRIMEDNPILPAGFINAVVHEAFRPEETVEMYLSELTNEDLLRLWDTLLAQNAYQLSVPYIARNVRIESLQFLPEGPMLQERTFALGQPANG